MAFRVDNDIEFLGTVPGGGTGNIAIGDAVSSIRRTPADVFEPGDVFPLKIEESAGHETAFCTLISETEIARTRVIDRWDRTGPQNTAIGSISLTNVAFTAGDLYCAGTLPQPMNIFLQPDGSFGYGAAVRATIFFPLISDIQDPDSNLVNGEVVVAVSGLISGDNLGGVFLYDDDGDDGTIDNVNIFDPGTVGSPRTGILIRQTLSIQAAFFNEDLSIYAVSGVARSKLHSLAKSASGSANAWMGFRVQRGNDGSPYADLDLTMRDYQSSEVAAFRARSYGSDSDYLNLLKPLIFPGVTLKSKVLSGREARVDADKRRWLNDAARGLMLALYSDTDQFRAVVDDLDALATLTPDNWEDNERALVLGRDAAGDTAPFWYYWLSGSSSTANGKDIVIPTAHVGGASWTEAGRFILGSALTTATAATGGSGAYVIDAFKRPVIVINGGGAIDNVTMAENDEVLLIRGDADVVVSHDAAKINTGGVDITLSATAPTLLLQSRNGVKFSAGGSGGGFQPVVTTLAAMGDSANAINTSGKYKNKLVDDENGRTWKATGSLATDAWWALDGMNGLPDSTVTPS